MSFEADYQALAGQGVIFLKIMTETTHGTAPEVEDLASFAEEKGLTMPVLADPGWRVHGRYSPILQVPYAVLFDRGAAVEYAGKPDLAELHRLIE